MIILKKKTHTHRHTHTFLGISDGQSPSYSPIKMEERRDQTVQGEAPGFEVGRTVDVSTR